MCTTRVGTCHHPTTLLLQTTYVHRHQIGVILLLEILIGQLRRTWQLVPTSSLLIYNAILSVECLLVFRDAGFQAGSPDFRLSAIDVSLISNILSQHLLLLLVNHRHLLPIHVMGLLLRLLLVVRLY
jgi:hypothetical protein